MSDTGLNNSLEMPRRGPGRPPGAKNKRTQVYEALLHGEAETILRKLIEAAVAGDVAAARLILDRIFPQPRARPVTFTLPDTSTAGGIAAAVQTVLTAVATGTLTPDEGSTVAGIIEHRRRAIDTDEHDARLTAIEARLAELPPTLRRARA